VVVDVAGFWPKDRTSAGPSGWGPCSGFPACLHLFFFCLLGGFFVPVPPVVVSSFFFFGYLWVGRLCLLPFLLILARCWGGVFLLFFAGYFRGVATGLGVLFEELSVFFFLFFLGGGGEFLWFVCLFLSW